MPLWSFCRSLLEGFISMTLYMYSVYTVYIQCIQHNHNYEKGGIIIENDFKKQVN